MSIDTSGARGSDGVDGANGASGADAGRAVYESVMGAEPGTSGRSTDQEHVWAGPSLKPAKPSQKPQTIINLPVMIRAIQGHMYAIHAVNAQFDFYILVHVEVVIPGDNCTISWKRLSDEDSPNKGNSSSYKNASDTPISSAAESSSSDHAVENADSGSSNQMNQRPRIKVFGSSLSSISSSTQATSGTHLATSDVTEDDVIRIDTRLVVSNVLVLDTRGRPVTGLPLNDFAVS